MRIKPLSDDRVVEVALSVGIAAIALQIAALTAYLPLELIGPDPDRGWLLLWVMPTWIVGLTLVGSFALRPLFRKLIGDDS